MTAGFIVPREQKCPPARRRANRAERGRVVTRNRAAGALLIEANGMRQQLPKRSAPFGAVPWYHTMSRPNPILVARHHKAGGHRPPLHPISTREGRLNAAVPGPCRSTLLRP